MKKNRQSKDAVTVTVTARVDGCKHDMQVGAAVNALTAQPVCQPVSVCVLSLVASGNVAECIVAQRG